MSLEHDLLGSEIVDWLTATIPAFHQDPSNPSLAHLDPNTDTGLFNLTPADIPLEVSTASEYFSSVQTLDELITQYWTARQSESFEHNLTLAMDHIHPWADDFLANTINSATESFNDIDASLIASFVKNLDIYSAIKCIESFLNHPQDMFLLRIAKQKQWQVHLDHINICSGNQENEDAERIVNFLIKHHHYYPPQMMDEAYTLYKILGSGQIIRIYIDQADTHQSAQAMSLWNHAYGYTAHHIGLRVTASSASGCRSISLPEIINELQQNNISVQTPQGMNSKQLMQQALIKSVRNIELPSDIAANTTIASTLKQGKRIEIVSRLELPNELKIKWFNLYQLALDPANPLHSAPVFNWFLAPEYPMLSDTIEIHR